MLLAGHANRKVLFSNGFEDSSVELTVRIGDGVDRIAGDLGEFLSAARHGVGELRVIEPRQRIVAGGVKADVRQPTCVLCGEQLSLRCRAGQARKRVGGNIALLGCQRLHQLTLSMDGARAYQLGYVDTAVDGPLKPLPPKVPRLCEERTAQEECRRNVCSAKFG